MSGFGYDVLGFGSGAGVAGPEVDENFNRVSFLSHFDGANNGVNNAFDDGSASNHTISEAGNVPVQGSFGPFAREAGNWSVDFSGASSPLIRVASDSNLAAGTGAYTVEAWVNWSNWTGTNQRIWLQGVAGTDGIVLGKDSGANTLFTKGGAINYSFTPTLGRWYHIAVVRADTNTNGESLYIDGTRVAQGTQSGSVAANQFIVSGLNWAGNYNVQGKVSNFRYTKAAVYSGSSFTPIEEPLSAITYTEILTCQDNRFIDNSVRARPILQNNYDSGKSKVSAVGPFLTDAAYDPAVNGASAFFTGAADDALTGPTSNDFGFGDNSFTVEVWIYPTVIDNYKVPIGTSGASGNGRWYISYGSPKIYWGSYGNGSDGDFTVDHDMTPNAWYHLAYVRNKSDDKGRLYVNGVQKGVQDDARTYANPSQVLKIGKDHTANNNMKGYISDARVVNGTAVYTSAFTPPAAPLTAITNTKLLLNMANGQAIDSAAQNNLTLIGGTKISTGQAKFGDTSIYFDGAGDYATLTNSASNNLGDGDWTIEGWLYLTANAGTGNDEFAVASKFGGGSTRSWLARIANGNKLTFWYINSSGTQVELTADTRVLSLNTWYHVAWVKNSNLKVYINGVGATLASSDFQIRDGTDLIQLSGRASGDNMYEGYIDDFRISSMARYTNNFTAPTKPFADKGQ